MKKLLWFVVSLVVLVLVAAGGVVGFVSTQQDEIKNKIVEQISAQTGRELAIGGDVSVKFWPSLAISVADVRFANHEKSDIADMVKLKSLDVSLAVKPLLDKQVKIEQFMLNKPEITLEQYKNGQNNWTLKIADQAAPKETDKAQNTKKTSAQDMQISFGEIAIKDARLLMIDHKAGTRQSIDQFNLTLDMPDLAKTARLTGDVTYGAIKADYDIKIDTLQKIIDQASDVGLDAVIMVADKNKITWRGGFNAKTGNLSPARLNVDLPDFPAFTKMVAGQAITAADHVTLSSKIAITPQKIDVSDLALGLDQQKLTGDVSVSLGKQVKVTTNLKSDQLDLDPILAKLGVKQDPKQASTAPKTTSQPFVWPDEKLDFSALFGNQITANLDIKSLGYQKLWIKNVDLSVKISDGRFSLDLKPAQLAEGTIRSQVTLDAAAKPAHLKISANLKDVRAKPVLTHWAGFDKLSGLTVFDLDVSSKGLTVKEFVGALNGAGQLYFKEGALEGVNASNIVQMVQRKMTKIGLYSEGRTEFVHTGGTYTIKNGVLYNKDFNLEGPLVLATGQGQVDLPAYQLAYRVKPELVVAQSVAERTGIVVPVDLVGRLDNIQVKPDYASVLKNALDNPENIEKGLKNIKNQLGNIEDNLKKDPAKAIESIFGGF